jgi:diguanylate cyclase (GGDEF)-like protein
MSASNLPFGQLAVLQRSWSIRRLWPVPVIVLGYWAANDLAAAFEITTYVSAAYLPAGVTVAVTMMLGAVYLPVIYLTICSMTVLIYGLPFAGFGYMDPLRETLVYGLAGLALRPIWRNASRLVTLKTAAFFLLVALAASTVSALLIQHIPPFQNLLADGETAIAFLGGDFAGVVTGVPAILMLRELLTKLARRELPPLSWDLLGRDLIYTVLATGTALVAAWLPVALQLETQSMALLMFLPIILAGLSNGIRTGFVVASIACLVFLHATVAWTAHPIQPIAIQMIFAVSVAVALLSGAAHDDRLFAWEQATNDLLTGLPNRRMLEDRLDQDCLRAEREDHRFALLYIDLDRFKPVNDGFGHRAGDQVLFETGLRLKQKVWTTDTVARIGGDEFMILLPRVSGRESAEALAEKVRAAIERPIALEAGETISVSASIGIAIYPDDGQDRETLTCHADGAMYAAKTQRHLSPDEKRVSRSLS